MSDGAESSAKKKQKVEDKKVLLRDVPATKFLDMIHLFDGPKVVITVEGQNFSLPKALLCYHSPFFERAFNGGFKEATEQKMSMTSCSLETFKLLIQWLYTSHVELGDMGSKEDEGVTISTEPGEVSNEHPSSRQITILLSFIKLADEIQLLGSVDEIVEMMKKKIIDTRSCLTTQHIRMAADLPKGHGVRTLFAQACVKDYAPYFFSSRWHRGGLWFRAELNELDGFAADLMRELDVVMEIHGIGYSGRSANHTFTDPLTKQTVPLKSFK
ncbi:uncharacterized protein LY89DRAFT_762551 [Mollisia scopiformis]|uniref:BTB domain-containing protein n=1 Tax=Mollisia scopiformis TaxID=149040 RepID=A0A194XQ90_MOLSC|nr:uncharacterized protein LY89DRAFT_762551 [Mollisia scopiformis]KUJ22425.1 hypothetical protein LY89DRAFT_762551 [Mollisia scopiformis]